MRALSTFFDNYVLEHFIKFGRSNPKVSKTYLE